MYPNVIKAFLLINQVFLVKNVLYNVKIALILINALPVFKGFVCFGVSVFWRVI